MLFRSDVMRVLLSTTLLIAYGYICFLAGALYKTIDVRTEIIKVLDDADCFGLGIPNLIGAWEPAQELDRGNILNKNWHAVRTLRCRLFVAGYVAVFTPKQLWIRRADIERNSKGAHAPISLNVKRREGHVDSDEKDRGNVVHR